MKFCKKCDTEKGSDDFYFDTTRQKLYSYCKECHGSLTADWSSRNKAKIAADARKRYRANPERFVRLSAEWRESHRETFLKRNRYSWFKRWNECVDGLGGKCSCCGETARTMLEIDHIGGNGNIHRRAAGGSVGVYNEIIALGFPRNKFQVLCGNCNKSKMRNSGLCEHITGPTDRTGVTVTRAHEVKNSQPSSIDRLISRFNSDCGTNPDSKPLAEMMIDHAYRQFMGLA